MKSSRYVGRMVKMAAFLLCVGSLFACGGGGTAVAGSGDLTPAQFDADLLASSAFKALQAQLTDNAATIKAQGATITAHGLTIQRMAAFGHSAASPLTASAARREASFNPHGGIVTDTITFGPCPDMGEHVGDAAPSPVSSATAYFKQCPINGAQYFYGAISGLGTIRVADKIWFTSSDCSTGAIEIDDGEMYNTMALTSGVVFRSPFDNSLVMVAAGQAGDTVTARSDFGGVCTTEDTTAPGYAVTANDVSVTGVPETVPVKFIY